MQQVSTNNVNNNFHQLKKNIFTVLIVVILLGGAGYFLFSNHKQGPSKPKTSAYEKGLHNQDYSNLDSFKLDGSKQATGISFEKPKDYVKAIESTDKSQVSFSHTLRTKNPAPLGALHVVSIPVKTDYKVTIAGFKKTMSDPSKEAYKSSVKPMEDFLVSRFSPLYDITYKNAKPVNSSNFSGNAWSIDLSATPKKSPQPASNTNTSPDAKVDTSKAQPVPKGVPKEFENYKGEVMMIIGKNGFYYVAIYNTDYNWDNNAAVWQQVIGSIKIDQ